MHPYLARIFGFFPDYNIRIVGSAVRDVTLANDIDILVVDSGRYPGLIHALGLKYNGWDAETADGLRYHLRRCNLRLPDIDRHCQLLDYGAYGPHYPFAQMLRDGSILNPDRAFNPLTDRSQFIERPHVDRSSPIAFPVNPTVS